MVRTGEAINVCRLDLWIDPIFDDVIERELRVRVSELPAREFDDITVMGLSKAHAYHVSAAKDELPRQWWVTAQLLAQCPQLLCVSSGGAGFDTVDVAACTKAGVAVVNQEGANADSVAEHTFGLLLSLYKRIIESNFRLRNETGFTREDLMGRELKGQTIGLIGLGQIGSRVALIAKAFGLNVLAYDPLIRDDQIRAKHATSASLDSLLASSDIVSVHCPLTEATRNMFNAERFGLMKKGAVFITTARGGIHDEQALSDALRSMHIGGAGLDVWSAEPPPHDHPLLHLPNVVATYHTAGVSNGGRKNVAMSSASQINMVLSGVKPPHLLNPEVWPIVYARVSALRNKL